MKKDAFIDQILIIIGILSVVVIFVATTNDEIKAANKISELKNLANITANNLAKYYEFENDICLAQRRVNEILQKTKLGKELKDKNLIKFIWKGNSVDDIASKVTVKIEPYKESTFWYKFIKLDSFTIKNIEETALIPKKKCRYTLRKGRGNALYENIVGTYTLDKQGCIENPRLLILNQKMKHYTKEIDMPPERFFLIPDGCNKFFGGNICTAANIEMIIDDSLPFEMKGCLNSTSLPTAKIDNKNIYSNTHIYFQDSRFQEKLFGGEKGISPARKIAKQAWPQYEYFRKYKGGGYNVWNKWKVYAKAKKINYKYDPENDYMFIFEDSPKGDNDYWDTYIEAKSNCQGTVIIEDEDEIIQEICN